MANALRAAGFRRFRSRSTLLCSASSSRLPVGASIPIRWPMTVAARPGKPQKLPQRNRLLSSLWLPKY